MSPSRQNSALVRQFFSTPKPPFASSATPPLHGNFLGLLPARQSHLLCLRFRNRGFYRTVHGLSIFYREAGPCRSRDHDVGKRQALPPTGRNMDRSLPGSHQTLEQCSPVSLCLKNFTSSE